MLRIADCLTVDHDLRLVLLAALICAVGAASTAIVSTRTTSARNAGWWLAMLSLCAAATVWATHFIAMLAYKTRVPITYDAGQTALSFLAGAAVIAAGFAIAVRGRRSAGVRAFGGVILGAGVVVLHYIGMAALRFPGRIWYDTDLVVASVVASTGLGALALWVLFGPRRTHTRIAGAAALIAMTVALHFTAMGAVQISLGFPGQDDVALGMSRAVLAGGVTIASLSVLLIGAVGAIVDQRVSHRLAAESERFRTLAEGAFEGLVVHRDGVIVDTNAVARQILGLGDDEDAAQRSIASWIEALSGDEAAAVDAGGGEPTSSERIVRRADGSSFPAEICRRRMLLADGDEGELLAIRDLTARKESEARIAHLALHDPLTDLPNRRFFAELANKTIATAQRGGECFALLALDLDGFKIVNDMHGHAAGDTLIRESAARINATLRDCDVAARLGGDEFTVLQTSAGQPEQAIRLAERLLEALQEPVRLGHAEVTVSVSIGVALYPVDGETMEELLRHADTALYRAKADGKATCRFFEPQMDAALGARRRLEARLRRAIVEERLSVAYQPVVDSASRSPLGFEALVRWNDEELGAITPNEFIPVAEESGLIMALGEFVLRRACFDAVTWPSALRVAVNLSVVQFRRPGLAATVRRALDDSGLAGDRLELEVTESLLIDNRDEALRILTELKSLGVRIAMDDFGTGYSSLSYLKSFPFDKIKIDRVFVADLQHDDDNACIVQAVAAMGKSLRMRVVAEGVETAGQAAMLEHLQCDELQGFLIAKPMPAAAVARFLRNPHLQAAPPVAEAMPMPPRASPGLVPG
jgi:diguanylate cyclase (GGDEF)-like protein/PAS domain S-box-containing protein